MESWISLRPGGWRADLPHNFGSLAAYSAGSAGQFVDRAKQTGAAVEAHAAVASSGHLPAGMLDSGLNAIALQAICSGNRGWAKERLCSVFGNKAGFIPE